MPSSTNAAASELALQALTLNIGAAALPRAERILQWLRRRHEDVFVLTETSGGEGSKLIAEQLDQWGYNVVWRQPSGDRGVLLATRLPIKAQLCTRLDVTLPWRIAGVRLAVEPSVAVLGVYMPSRERSPKNVAKKRLFIESFLAGVERLTPTIRSRLVIAGDYNAISRRHDPPRYGFLECEYALHEELERLGFAAGHELVGARPQPHSWIGRTGDGYLYDYFHLGRGLREHLRACRYLHAPRERRLSDHAAVAIALA